MQRPRHDISLLFLLGNLRLPKDDQPEREAEELEQRQGHASPTEAQVINGEFFTAGLEEIFGCKLSCTVAFLEKAVVEVRGTKIRNQPQKRVGTK